MLEQSYGLNFFLKSPNVKSKSIRYVYLRITVNGIAKETSTKRKWDLNRWDQKAGKAIGTKEDAKALNFFLESLTTKINSHKIDLLNNSINLSAAELINFVNGRRKKCNKILEEFLEHNNEIADLIITKEYAKGTHERYVTARSHVQEFIQYKYKMDDLEFSELNYEFIKDYDLYLKTIRKCSNNTTLKYISNFKKIVLRAIAKEIILKDPFQLFVSKKTKIKKEPLTVIELKRIENKEFDSERLSIVRDIFIFQCYTGLCYIDAYQLSWSDIKELENGSFWIMSKRQKSKSQTDIPLLPKALEILKKYKNHPLCANKNTVLPGRSNQKKNEYLKEISVLCGVNTTLNTHKARRTFASTITLNNGVPIHVVKEMLGHHSVKQTEDYAITKQQTIAREMKELENKLNLDKGNLNSDLAVFIKKVEIELQLLKDIKKDESTSIFRNKCIDFELILEKLKKMI